MRYVREYATYQRLQGEEILKKQEQIRKKKAERQQVKAAKEGLLKERENEKAKLEAQEKEKRTLVANLQKKQKGLQSEVNKKTGGQSTECPYRPVDRRRNRTRPQTCCGRSPPRSGSPQEGGYKWQRCLQNRNGCQTEVGAIGRFYDEQGRSRTVR